MDRLIFEGRCLLGIAGTIMRQDDLRIIHKRLDWEKMYRMADYHRIANIVYLGILGHGEDVPERWRERFFEKYQEYLRLSEICDEAEREVLNLFEMRKVPCVLLGSNEVRRLYQIEEAAGIHSLSFMMDKESYSLAKGYLIDLGYELLESLEDAGIRLKGPSGLMVDLYWRLPFKPPYYEKAAIHLVEKAVPADGFSQIYILKQQDYLVLCMVLAVYAYVSNALTLQNVLDLYVIYRKWWNENSDELKVRLREFKIEELAQRLLDLTYMWFADKKTEYLQRHSFSEEDSELFDSMESRLLTRGMISREKEQQALALDKAIQKELEKEKRRDKILRFKQKIQKKTERIKKSIKWILPSYSYMCSLYPILEKMPVLYPLFWVIRGLRRLRIDLKREDETE